MITENADKWVLQQHVAMYERLLLEELTKANSTKSRRNELTELLSDAKKAGANRRSPSVRSRLRLMRTGG
jgi:hypothetical protein